MSKPDKITILTVFAYGQIQEALHIDGLLNKDGSPKKLKKKELTIEDVEVLKIYEYLSERLIGYSEAQLLEIAKYGNEGIKKSVNLGETIQPLVFGLLLFRSLVESLGGMAYNLHFNRSTRVLDYAIKKHKEENKLSIYTSTSRAADNLVRFLNGNAQLSNDVREAKNKKWLKGA